MERLFKDFSERGWNIRVMESTGAELMHVSRNRALANASQMAIGVAQLMRCTYIQQPDGSYKRITEEQFEKLPQRVITRAQTFQNQLDGGSDIDEMAGRQLLEQNPPEAVREWREQQLPNEADAVPLAQGDATPASAS